MRGGKKKAVVGRKVLMKAIANFIKGVLSNTTLAQKVDLPKTELSQFGTQTVQHPTTPTQRSPVAFPSTSSVGDVVFGIETNTFSSRIVADDDDDDDDDVPGDVSEGEVRKFAVKSFVEIASPYL